MTRDKFVDLIFEHREPSPNGDIAGEEILAEYDRLTERNAMLLNVLREVAAGEWSYDRRLQHCQHIAEAAIRAAESTNDKKNERNG